MDDLKPESWQCQRCGEPIGWLGRAMEWLFGSMHRCGARAPADFIKHDPVEDGFSEWVTPNPNSYFMKCCDCGLVHEAQFRVSQFQPRPSEDFAVVNDPDLQAQFRMRRAFAE